MTLRPPDPSPVTQAGPSGRRPITRITALRDVRTGVEIPLADERRYVVGKGDSCDVVLPDPCVSRIHCVLERQGLALFVRDSGSRNGTFINERKIECAELTPGTVLTVGMTQLVALGPPGHPRSGFDRLIGRDPMLRAAIDLATRAAASDCSVLILGETGTGKDLLAQAIHDASRRAGGPFVPLNCGAIPRELVGSELFGHDKGAFTGAVADREGVFVQADRGTLFLDELGELPLEQQPHLLRALETRRVRRVGGVTERDFDARIIAATNREAHLGTERGALRVDLYHRVATVLVRLPPLRTRPGDLDELCGAFLEQLAREHGPRRLSAGARRVIREHAWPGNVRELRQALVRAVTFSQEVIEPEHLFPTLWRLPVDSAASPPDPGEGAPTGPAALPSYEAMVREAMIEALERYGSIRAAADALGMAKSTFADRARRLGVPLATARGRR
ncbi:MAG: sigma 54-interacting transcriptional regulator [Kofleriaceae bacterium]